MGPSRSSKSSLDDNVAAETGLEGLEMSPETKILHNIIVYQNHFITVNQTGLVFFNTCAGSRGAQSTSWTDAVRVTQGGRPGLMSLMMVSTCKSKTAHQLILTLQFIPSHNKYYAIIKTKISNFQFK